MRKRKRWGHRSFAGGRKQEGAAVEIKARAARPFSSMTGTDQEKDDGPDGHTHPRKNCRKWADPTRHLLTYSSLLLYTMMGG